MAEMSCIQDSKSYNIKISSPSLADAFVHFLRAFHNFGAQFPSYMKPLKRFVNLALESYISRKYCYFLIGPLMMEVGVFEFPLPFLSCRLCFKRLLRAR